MAIPYAQLGQGVYVRRNGIRISVASENGAHVLRRDPEYVGFSKREKGCEQNEQEQKKACRRKDVLLKDGR